MPPLTEIARAKVNLTLHVVSRRADGYHELESIVAFADCADTLSLTEQAEIELSVTGPAASACGASHDNLVMRAAQALCARVEDFRGGHFTLDKHLPVAAGIGGGSADAAAALRLLARLNEMPLDDPRLVAVAAATGADIPVCIASNACVMEGVGDRLTAIDLPALPAVLVNPRVPVATKDVFAALGLKAGTMRVGVMDVLQAPAWPKPGAPRQAWLTYIAAGVNDLEKPALRVEPMIGEVLAALREAAGVKLARMSGSGATCFALFDDDPSAQAAAASLRETHPGWWVHAGTLS